MRWDNRSKRVALSVNTVSLWDKEAQGRKLKFIRYNTHDELLRAVQKLKLLGIPCHKHSEGREYDLNVGKEISIYVALRTDTLSILSDKPLYLLYDIGNIFEYTKFSEIDLTNVDMAHITSMQLTFKECNAHKIIFDKSVHESNIHSLDNTFNECVNLESLDLTMLDNTKLESLKKAFYRCENLREIKFDSTPMINLKNLAAAFARCTSLKKLDLSMFVTDTVISMNCMFLYSGLEEADLRHFSMKSIHDLTPGNYLLFGDVDWVTRKGVLLNDETYKIVEEKLEEFNQKACYS